jgi:hypothetical protein
MRQPQYTIYVDNNQGNAEIPEVWETNEEKSRSKNVIITTKSE